VEDTEKTKEELLNEITELRLEAEALRLSEAKYRHFYENAVEGIFQCTPDGHFISVNPAFSKMVGFESPRETVEALNKTGDPIYVYPEDKERLRSVLEEYSVVMDFELQIYRIDGKITWTSINAHAVRDETGKIVCIEGFSEDITARKEAEEKLRKERETFFTILENDPTGVVLIDPNGTYQYINPEFTRITGYVLEDIPTGKDWLWKAYPDPAYRKEVIRIWKEDRLSETSKYLDREFTITCKDGSLRDIDIRTTFMTDFSISVFRDITGRKEVEKNLRESEAKYRSVVEDSLVGFYIIQDGYFRFVNKRFCEIFGYAYEEIVDLLGHKDLTHPDDRRLIDENVRKRISGEIENIEYDFRSIRKDGKIIMVKVLGSSVFYQGRRAAVGSIIDITKERELESKLRQAQKMEAIGTMAGGIAHDFNNLLTIITGYSELLQMETAEEDHLREYVNQILSASTKASELTRSLLTFSRQQPVVLRPLNINDIIRETEKLLKRLITENITLDISLASGVMIVMADTTQINQILFNLAGNARDVMPTGGTLSIETKNINIGPDFVENHGFGKPGQYVLISVSDTGLGMDSATRDQLFDPFFTTKAVGKGTGLGLSTVYGIVKQHNGYITVYSEPEAGTTFNIYFPGVLANIEEETLSSPIITGGTETILLAEDDDSVRRIISNILTIHGYTVIEAIDGRDAVEKSLQHKETEAIILDSVMPKMSGREAYEEIRRSRPDIKVLFISGYTRDIILDKGIRDKDFHFISKPVLSDILLRTLREILDE
jgi:two-component system cell cycle sensor histidine kinase/response regulator CckA